MEIEDKLTEIVMIVKNLTDRNAVLESTLVILQAEETAELLERLGYTIGFLSTNEDVKKAFAIAAKIREALHG